MMFAEDKGAAENLLSTMYAGTFYTFRPGYIYPVKSVLNRTLATDYRAVCTRYSNTWDLNLALHRTSSPKGFSLRWCVLRPRNFRKSPNTQLHTLMKYAI